MRALRTAAVAAVMSFLLLAAAPARTGTGTNLYATATAPLYADPAGHKTEGSLTPGTAVATTGPAAQALVPVAVEGWSQEGDASTVFAAPGQRIVLAELASGTPAPKVLATRKDAYDNVWNQVKITGFVAATALVADQNTVWAQAQKLYSTRCSACHALHNPNEFTANQWPKILGTMAKNAALQPAEAALVTQYLQTHAKQ